MVKLYKVDQEEINKLFARCQALLHISVLLPFIHSEGFPFCADTENSEK